MYRDPCLAKMYFNIFHISLVIHVHVCLAKKNYKKGDKVYQLLVHGQWFSPDSPASSTTKTGRHDIAKILLKVALNTINKSINQFLQKTFLRRFMLN
jgi:hypothetical protein